jgi:hypothetical protein
MKQLSLTVCISLILILSGKDLSGQDEIRKVWFGPGFGMDYGGIGGKIEFLPAPHFGVFGGLGYNLLSAGWNLGATYKILPHKKVSPNIMAFYGYNGVFKGADSYAKRYEMTSYGLTLGANLDIFTRRNGSKLSVGLFVPIRSGKFRDNYDAAQADSGLELKKELLPVAFSIGYNFAL